VVFFAVVFFAAVFFAAAFVAAAFAAAAFVAAAFGAAALRGARRLAGGAASAGALSNSADSVGLSGSSICSGHSISASGRCRRQVKSACPSRDRAEAVEANHRTVARKVCWPAEGHVLASDQGLRLRLMRHAVGSERVADRAGPVERALRHAHRAIVPPRCLTGEAGDGA